ncbi:MAG: serine/threonine-protein kinase [Pseudonocardiaceae bacterium]
MADARGQSAHSGDDTFPELPGYRIERQLGRGSMGVVYLAEDVQLRRKVALKILTPNLADDELFRKRFDRESQSAANLDHPHIVPVYAVGEAAGSLYIAMRYVSGGDLRALIETNGPLSFERATTIVASVADALDAAHAQGMVHRDVKPANILFDGRHGQEHYYLSDFGITKIVSPGRSLTSTGQIVGTIDYIAPEQIQGKPVDGRADLYALGCVLYHCLTGEVPFPREEVAAFMWAHVHDEPPPVTTRRPELPPQIDGIVAKAMAKQPEDRYTTCRELALALRDVTVPTADSGKVSPARPVDSPPPPPISAGMTSTYIPLTPAPAGTPGTIAAPGRKWWWWAAWGVAALVLIGGSTAGVRYYLNARSVTAAQQRAAAELATAERTLIEQVPFPVRKGCERNADAERDTANVLAAVTCPSDGGTNQIVFTKFISPQARDNHYNADVATAVANTDVAQNSGHCRSDEKAEGEYVSRSGRIRGRALCHQLGGASVIEWTENGSPILGVATWADPDHTKLATWWANVVDVALPTPKPTPQPTPELTPRPTPEPTPEPTPSPTPSPTPEPTPSPSPSPVSPTNSPTPTPIAPPPPQVLSQLSGPTPAAPGPQQGVTPEPPGTGGCIKVPIISRYACTIPQGSPVYLAETTEPRINLPTGRHPLFVCQTDGSTYAVGNRSHSWWAWVSDGRAGGWVPVAFLAGSTADGPEPGLPVCTSAPTTTDGGDTIPNDIIPNNPIPDAQSPSATQPPDDSNTSDRTSLLDCLEIAKEASAGMIPDPAKLANCAKIRGSNR